MATRGKVQEVSIAEARPSDRLTVEEVAELTGMTHGRVCQLLRSGEMTGSKFRGIVWEVERREAEKFVASVAGRGRPRGS